MAQKQFELFKTRKQALKYSETARKVDALIFHCADDERTFFNKCVNLANEAYGKKEEAMLWRKYCEILRNPPRADSLARRNLKLAWHPFLHAFYEIRHNPNTLPEFMNTLECRPLEFFERFWLCYDPNKPILPFGASRNICDRTHFHINGPLLNPYITNAQLIAKLRKATKVYLAKELALATDENGNVNPISLKDLVQQANDLVEIDAYFVNEEIKYIKQGIEFAKENIIRSRQKLEKNACQGCIGGSISPSNFGSLEMYRNRLIAIEALPMPFNCPAMQTIFNLVEQEKVHSKGLKMKDNVYYGVEK